MRDRKTVVWGISYGLIGGLAGTVLMDIVIVATFLLAGERGDGFFAMVGDRLGSSSIAGVAIHNMIGLSVGALFAVAVLSFEFFWIDSRRKGLMLGVLAGAITIPLGCIPLAIWLGESILIVVAFSAVPHLVYGTVLGYVVAFGLISRGTPEAGSLT